MKFANILVMWVVSLLFGVAAQAQEAGNPSAATAPGGSQSPSQAIVPRLVKFSGTLLDPQDRPMVGLAGVTFALYAQHTGGAALWMETQNVKPDEQGNYTVLLGAESVHGVPEELFASGEARWLGVQPERQTELPRVLLVSVPYALKAGDAETLGGLPPSAFLGASLQTAALAGQAQTAATSTSVNTQPLVPQAASVGGTGAANFIPLWTNSTTQGNSLLFQKGSAVQFPATSTATALKGANSSALDLISSAFKKGGPASNQLFRWQAEPAGNNTATPSGTLNLLFASGAATPGETGLSINNKGQITFATGQAFPTVTGNETVTGNVSAGQLISTAANGTAPLKVTSTTLVPNLNASLLGGLPAGAFATLGANTFTGSQSIAGNGLDIFLGNVGCGALSAGIQASNVAANCLNFALRTDGSATSTMGTYINRPSGGAIHFREANGSDQMVISPGGQVGIGVLPVSAQVEVQASPNLDGFVSFGADGTNAGSTGVKGIGGSAIGPSGGISTAGTGVIAGGGSAAASGTKGGIGLIAEGGFGTVNGASGGSAIVALGGSGTGAGSLGGFGIEAQGGLNFDGSFARAGEFRGDVEVTGCLSVSGVRSGTCQSDVRLKKNIQPFSPVLDKLVRLQPVSYYWRVEEYPQFRFASTRITGLIAQEVEKVFPEMVSVDEAGYKRVNYGELPYLMLQAIRELKAENDQLQTEMKVNQARWKEHNRAQAQRVNVTKDRQIQKLTQQVQELQEVQQRLEALEGRLARMEAPTGGKELRAATVR